MGYGEVGGVQLGRGGCPEPPVDNDSALAVRSPPHKASETWG